MGDLLEKISNFLKNQQKKDSNFNEFNICRIGNDEVRHSAIIAALLDPNGALGKSALMAFLKQAGLRELSKVIEEYGGTIHVDTEYSISGRRMDIVIHSDMFCVVIENKTVTVDHDMQLADYRRWLDNQNNKSTELLYLTYYGEEAVNYQGEYKRISYKEHICKWLEECVKSLESSGNNVEVSTFCRQYCEFIKGFLLGGKLKMEDQEFNEIRENIEAALEISNRINEAKARLLDSILKPTLKNEGFMVRENDWGEIMTGHGLDYNVCKHYKDCQIEFGFDRYNFQNSRIRITFPNNCGIPDMPLDDWKKEKIEEKEILVRHDNISWDDKIFIELAKKGPNSCVEEYERRFETACYVIDSIYNSRGTLTSKLPSE